jgi:hypothetical protein
MTNLAELKARLLEDPQTRAHYDAQASEFALARELIGARTRAGLSQTKVPATSSHAPQRGSTG